MADPTTSTLGGDHDARPEASVRESRVLTKKSGWQMAYQAWVTNAQTVLRQRREQARQERTEQQASGELCLGAPGGELQDMQLMLTISVPRR